MSHRTYLIPYKLFRGNCEGCTSLLSQVFVGNPRMVTVFCPKPKCEHMPSQEEEMIL